jgi:glutamate-1-semialdehyde 2,1-aminomutase
MPTNVAVQSSMPKDTTLVKRALAVFPGGSLGESYTPPELIVVVDRGQGDKVWDTDGHERLDFTMGWGSVILGHAHPALTEALGSQAALGANFSHVNQRAIELGEEVISAVPCAERLRFCASGAEATLHAVALARAFTQRPKILKFEGAYHGAHDVGTVSYMPRQMTNFPLGEAMSAATPPRSNEDVLVAPFNDAAATAAIVEAHRKEIAAIIVEPLHRSTAAAPGFLQELRRIADAMGVLLIFDEVVTGFRLAYGGAQEYYGVKADIAALGKALGGGYPIGAVAGRADIIDICEENRVGDPRYVYLGSTLGGNPVSMAVGLAVLKELRKPGTYPRLFELGDRLREGLRRAFAEAGIAVQMLGVGPQVAVAFCEHEVRDYRTWLCADQKRRRTFMTGLFKRGIFVNPHGSKLYLSCAHTPQSVDTLIGAAEDTVRKDF